MAFCTGRRRRLIRSANLARLAIVSRQRPLTTQNRLLLSDSTTRASIRSVAGCQRHLANFGRWAHGRAAMANGSLDPRARATRSENMCLSVQVESGDCNVAAAAVDAAAAAAASERVRRPEQRADSRVAVATDRGASPCPPPSTTVLLAVHVVVPWAGASERGTTLVGPSPARDEGEAAGRYCGPCSRRLTGHRGQVVQEEEEEEPLAASRAASRCPSGGASMMPITCRPRSTQQDRKSTRLNSSHAGLSRMPSSA